jgi:hypothetical protein
MIFALTAVNTALAENHMNKPFKTMEDLLAFVKEEGFEWTSLTVIVLPKIA